MVCVCVDYPEVIVPAAPENAMSFDGSGPRLMITRIVNENFKSYAGTETLGPFHKASLCHFNQFLTSCFVMKCRQIILILFHYFAVDCLLRYRFIWVFSDSRLVIFRKFNTCGKFQEILATTLEWLKINGNMQLESAQCKQRQYNNN